MIYTDFFILPHILWYITHSKFNEWAWVRAKIASTPLTSGAIEKVLP